MLFAQLLKRLKISFPCKSIISIISSYRNDRFHAVNFKTDQDGALICPNGKEFIFIYRKPMKENLYGCPEEIIGAKIAAIIHTLINARRLIKAGRFSSSKKLTVFRQEALDNQESIHGALLRMNRFIQAEGRFGIMKYDPWYKRIVRKGLK